MGRPSQYMPNFRERAVRMVAEICPHCDPQRAAVIAVASKLGVDSAEIVRGWVRRAEVGHRPGVTNDLGRPGEAQAGRRGAMRHERDPEGSGLLRGRARAAREPVIYFISEHKNDRAAAQGLHWGVELMCQVLTEHGLAISASTCRLWAGRRRLREEQLVELIANARAGCPFGATLSPRIWGCTSVVRGHEVARGSVQRIMREHGWEGARYGARRPVPPPEHPRSPDVVDRQFTVTAPNWLWVAVFIYRPTWTGKVYVTLVINANFRWPLGWRAVRSMTSTLIVDALERALFTREQDGLTDLRGLVAHNHAGSQDASAPFTGRRLEQGIDPSVGSVGDALDDALAETTFGLCKNELVRRQGPWRDVDHVGQQTLNWVGWFNNPRPHGILDEPAPIGVEELHHAQRAPVTTG